MEDKNTIKISNGKLQVAVTELNGLKLSSPELVAKSILLLINSLDVKYFEEHGIRDKFEGYMEQFLDELHGVYEWGATRS